MHTSSTAECHLAEWFIKGAAHDTYWHTILLQAFFVWHSNFGDFWVAPYMYIACLVRFSLKCISLIRSAM